MAGWSIIRIAGVFSLLSAAVLIATIAIGISVGGGGPVALDFGDSETLRGLAASGPTGNLLEVLALVAPTLALGGAIGWLDLAGKDRGEARVGVLLWYLGMIFVVAQDAVEVAAFETLPHAWLAAGPATGDSILALGSLTGRVIDIWGRLGDLVSGVGIALVAVAMLGRGDRLRHFAWVGFGAVLGQNLGFWIPALAPLRLLGFLLMLVWIVGLGVVMLRRGNGVVPPWPNQ